MKAIFCSFLVLISFHSLASSSLAGKISNVHFMYDSSVLFTTDGNYQPSGASTGWEGLKSNNWAIYPKNDKEIEMKAQISGLLMAYAAGKKVVVVGTHSCRAANEIRETVLYFYIP